MAVPYFGDFAEDATVYIPFNTFSSDDPSASVTITNLADGDLKVHKDGSVTQIVTDGATIAVDFDSITGNHLATIDTSAHADYSVGSDYMVRMEGTTVDGATINAWIGLFSIENREGHTKGALILTDTEAVIADTEAVLTDSEAIIADTEAAVPVLTDTEAILTDSEAILTDSEAILVDTSTTLDTVVDAILVDTEAAITERSTLLTDTEAILVDTGTTLDTVVDAVLVDTEAVLADTEAAVPVLTDTEAILTDSEAVLTDTEAAAPVLTDTEAITAVTAALGATAAANLKISAEHMVTGTVDTVTNTHTPTTTEFQADDITEATADHFNGRIVIFTSGVLQYQATDITDYVAVGGIGQFTVTAMTEAPSNNDTFIIV